ncbi:retrovirus-related pol polyprotein from transposon TNT 1-94 [Tanacetum coccineum]
MVTPAPQDRWSQDKHIKPVNIIGNPGAGMLTSAMDKQLSAASAHECLFVDFLSKEEPKKVFEALKYLGWVDAMQDELNQFARNKVWTLIPTPYGKTIISSKWIFRNKRDETGIVIKNKARLVAQGYNHTFLNGKLKEEVYVKQPPGFKSNEFPNHVYKLDKALYGLIQAPRAWYLKGTPSLGLWYPKCLGFDLKGYSDSDYAGCNMDRKSTLAEAEYVVAAGCCANILWIKRQLTDYDIIYEKVPVFCDSTSAIAISNNPVLYSRTKHIDIRYHFIRDHILKGDIELHFIPTQYQLADIFTKPLDEPTFKRLIIELGGVRGEIGITTFRNALREQYLPHSSMYVPPPSITTVKPWFTTIGYRGEIGAKETLKKCCLPPRVHVDYEKIIWEDLIHKLNKKTREKIVPYPRFLSLLLEHMMPEYENEEFTINPTQVFSVHNLTLKPNQPEEPPFTDHMKAIFKLYVPVDSKAPKPSSQTEEVPKAKSLELKVDSKENDLQNTHLSPPLRHPNPKLANQKRKQSPVRPRTKSQAILHLPHQCKAGGFRDILKDTRSAFFTHDSPSDEPIIVSYKSEEEEKVHLLQSQKEELEQAKAKGEAEVASMKAKPSYLDIHQLTKLLIKELKKHVRDMEIELPGDLRDSNKTRDIHFHYLQSFIPVQQKLKTLDSLPSMLHKVTNTLNRFATMVENASGATSMNVPSTGKATASPTEGEKNTKDAKTNLQKQLIDLLGIEVVEQYHSKKLHFDKYCDKMLKRRKISKIINCDVLTQKGHISLKVYREDGLSEVIENLKVSNLHLAEWREVVQACPDRREK